MIDAHAHVVKERSNEYLENAREQMRKAKIEVAKEGVFKKVGKHRGKLTMLIVLLLVFYPKLKMMYYG